MAQTTVTQQNKWYNWYNCMDDNIKCPLKFLMVIFLYGSIFMQEEVHSCKEKWMMITAFTVWIYVTQSALVGNGLLPNRMAFFS